MVLELLPIAFVGIGGIVGLGTIASWYRVVDPSQAHLVVSRKEKFIVSSDDSIATEGKKAYFAIPSNIPYIARSVRVMDLTIMELKHPQETYEKGQARFGVTSSLKYRIANVKVASETFTNEKELKGMLEDIVESSVRQVTANYNVEDVRSQKNKIQDEIVNLMKDDLAQWGLEFKNFQLVDFTDTPDSTIISDISKRREVAIKATTREMNAEKDKNATMKEAAAEEESGQRIIEKDRTLAEQKEIADMMVSEKKKEAEEKRFEVVKVQTIKQADINKAEAKIIAEQQKEVAIIKAEEDKDAEKIMMEQKRLEGEGDRLRAEERAKGEAAPILEKGKAEATIKLEKGLADAKVLDEKQKALNKYTPDAIRAMTAELIVEKDRQVGIENAQALKEAEIKILSGADSGGSNAGWDLTKVIEASNMNNDGLSNAILNKIAKPNDLGVNINSAPSDVKEMISDFMSENKEMLTQNMDESIEDYKERITSDVIMKVKENLNIDLTPQMISMITDAVLEENRRRNGF